MFTLLIVDDEKIIREGLQTSMNWIDYGISNVYTAADGFEALSLCESITPDILITDVRMPKMDGIALATALREKYINLVILYLSAYFDKEYLLSAIDNSVLTYIEKPIDFSKFDSIMKKAMTQCEINMQLESSIKNSEYIRKKNIMQALCRPYKSNSDNKYYNQLSSYDFFTMIAISLKFNNNINFSSESMRKDIFETIDRYLIKNGHNCVIEYKDKYIFVCILSNHNKNIIEKTILNLYNELRSNYHTDAFFSVGSTVTSVKDVYFSYENACINLQEFFFLEYNNIVFDKDILSYREKFPLNNIYDDLLIKCLENLQFEEAKQYLEKIKLQIRGSLHVLKNTYVVYFFNLISRILKFNCFTPEQKNKLEAHSLETLSHSNTLSEMINCIILIIDDCQILFEELGTDNISIKIRNYLEKNYSKKNISVQIIAEYIGYTVPYTCFLYKKETNSTINELITEIRLKHAAKILINQNTKLSAVANEVGFKDANYFTRKFKKHYGILPSEFRRMYKSE